MNNKIPLAVLQRSASRLLEVVGNALERYEIGKDLRKEVLAGILAAEHDHVAAIQCLVGDGQVYSADALLRSVIEGWIVAQYVSADESARSAAAYAAKGLRTHITFLERIDSIARGSSDERVDRAIRGLNLSSSEERTRQIADKCARLAELESYAGRKGFPSVFACAKSLGVVTEFIYTSLYGLALSDAVHIGPLSVLRVIPASGERNAENDSYNCLWTSLALLVGLARLAGKELGRPTEDELADLDKSLVTSVASFLPILNQRRSS